MTFQGDKKTGQSVLAQVENRLKARLLPCVPKQVETYHLTLTTILWSVLIIVFSFMARHNIHWLWAVSVMIVLQYITDLLDGAIGRERNTGLVKWGYYMDHFLDYIFLCAILIGYALLLPDAFKVRLFYVMAFFGAFMINSFLSFAATNEFRISYMGVGPTEVRILFIVVNALLVCFGRTYMVRALPFVLTLATFGLFVTVFRTQKELWQIDMEARDGAPPPKPEGKPVPNASIIARRLTEGIAGRTVVRNVVLSLLLAAAAVVILAMKVLYPYHRALSILVYAVSWVPFLLSFREKRAVIREQGRLLGRSLRPYLLHAGVALLLLVLARSAWVLCPAEQTFIGGMPAAELGASVDEAMADVLALNQSSRSLLDWTAQRGLLATSIDALTNEERDAVRTTWRDFVDLSMELEILKRRYKGFYQVDYLTQPEHHAGAFFVAYAALITQYRAALRFEEQVASNPQLQTMLNEPIPDEHIPANSYADIKQRLTHPDELLRLNAGAAYLAFVRKDISDPVGLLPVIEADIPAVYKALGKHPERLATAPLDLLERTLSSAWLPFQKEVAIRMSETRVTDRENFITPKLIGEHKARLKPGDLLLERRNWYMTNVGIPGFWPHVAVYIGTPPEMDAYFADLASLQGRTASAHLARTLPAAFALLTQPTATGARRNVIEALRDGVVFSAIEKSGNCDYLAALRPRVNKEDKFAAVAAAMSQAGKPYDYNFDFATDAALVCSELAYKAYAGASGLSFELVTINGRPLLPPNRIARKFADEFNTPGQQLDLVLFLDGSETLGTALPSDTATFRSTWARPKWDVLLQ